MKGAALLIRARRGQGGRSFRGAALLITLLLVSILATVLLGTARLTIREIKSARAFADATGAYFSAESGIEDGLFRYRENRDVELPPSATKATTTAQRIALNQNLDGGVVPIGSGSFDPLTSYYDLKIWYKDSQIGDVTRFNSTDTSTYEVLPKDALRELSGFPTDRQTILRIRAQAATSGVNVCLERRTFSPAGGGVTFCDPVTTSPTDITAAVGPNERLLLRSFGAEMKLAIAPATGSPNQLFDSGVSHIESTGYFGGVKRKLEAKIDRRSGTVIGLFDHTVFSGSGSL